MSSIAATASNFKRLPHSHVAQPAGVDNQVISSQTSARTDNRRARSVHLARTARDWQKLTKEGTPDFAFLKDVREDVNRGCAFHRDRAAEFWLRERLRFLSAVKVSHEKATTLQYQSRRAVDIPVKNTNDALLAGRSLPVIPAARGRKRPTKTNMIDLESRKLATIAGGPSRVEPCAVNVVVGVCFCAAMWNRLLCRIQRPRWSFRPHRPRGLILIRSRPLIEVFDMRYRFLVTPLACCLCLTWVAHWLPVTALATERPTSDPTALPGAGLTFERDIRPILRAHCWDCHGAVDEVDGNLDLRLVRLMVAGGDSGAAVAAGAPEASLLIQRVRQGEMPPGEAKVSPAELEILEHWIAAGAKTARPEPKSIGPGLPILPEDRQWWAFQPLRRPEVQPRAADRTIPDSPPAETSAAQARTPIDTLLLQSMPEGLRFSADADRRGLAIRLYFDLIGLPPTPQQLADHLRDRSPDAYERLVDQLLQSPHYGERWGRHWQDVAGYCDSEGRTAADAPRAWAYKYRDYVIGSFNADKPLDQFILEQLAGDELAGPLDGDLTPQQIEWLTATGFLRMAADGTGSGDNSEEARNLVIADALKIVSSSLLGLSYACAQCHDHRYDPISHTDYFALRSVFEPALDWKNWKTPAQRYVSLYTADDRAAAAQIEAEAQSLVAERDEKQKRYLAEALDQELLKYESPLREELRQAYETAADKRTETQQALLAQHPSVNITPGVLYQYNQVAADDLKQDAQRIAAIRTRKPREEFLRVLTEPVGHAPTAQLFHRGDYRQPRQTVAPAAPAILCPEDTYLRFPTNDETLPTTGRRRAFAGWLTGKENPITARVLANRIWMHLMGRGLVATPGEFGRLGAEPTHPRLLDYLATELIAGDWSTKRLQRLIVTSTAYRQSAKRDPAMAAIDDDNRYYWRAFVKRLDAEVVRDRLLATTGQLDSALFGPATPIKEDDTGQVIVDSDNRRRSVYIQQRRSQPVAMLQAFDAPVMETNCEIRPSSTVATQSLMLMNSDFILAQASKLAQKIASRPADAAAPGETIDLAGLPLLQSRYQPAWQLGYGAIEMPTLESPATAAQGPDAADASAVVRFHRLPHFESGTWQGSAQRPDPKIGWVLLNASGGHTGTNPDHAAIRRWTAPLTGTVGITGLLQHPSESGDGVRGRIVSSRRGVVGDWIVKQAAVDTAVQALEVVAGDTLDFVTDCRQNVTSDSFHWVVEIVLTQADGQVATWKSNQGFPGPAADRLELRPDHLVRAWQSAYGRPPTTDELGLAIEFINQQCQEMTLRPRELPAGGSPPLQALANLCQVLLTSNEFLYVH